MTDNFSDLLKNQIQAINNATISAYERGKLDGYQEGFTDGLKRAQEILSGPTTGNLTDDDNCDHKSGCPHGGNDDDPPSEGSCNGD